MAEFGMLMAVSVRVCEVLQIASTHSPAHSLPHTHSRTHSSVDNDRLAPVSTLHSLSAFFGLSSYAPEKTSIGSANISYNKIKL